MDCVPKTPKLRLWPLFWPRCEPRVFRVLAVQRFKDLVVRILLSNITWRHGCSPSGLRSISSRWWMAKWLMIDWAKTTLATWVWIWQSPPESNLVSWHQSSQSLTLTQHVATNKSCKKKENIPRPEKKYQRITSRATALEDVGHPISTAGSDVHRTAAIFALRRDAKTGPFQGIDREVIRLLGWWPQMTLCWAGFFGLLLKRYHLNLLNLVGKIPCMFLDFQNLAINTIVPVGILVIEYQYNSVHVASSCVWPFSKQWWIILDNDFVEYSSNMVRSTKALHWLLTFPLWEKF